MTSTEEHNDMLAAGFEVDGYLRTTPHGTFHVSTRTPCWLTVIRCFEVVPAGSFASECLGTFATLEEARAAIGDRLDALDKAAAATAASVPTCAPGDRAASCRGAA